MRPRKRLATLAVLANGPDRHATLADTRTAINLANGVHISEIDPAGGYNVSPAAYEDVHNDWATYLNGRTPDEWDRRDLTATRAYWAAVRPDLVADDDWAARLLGQQP